MSKIVIGKSIVDGKPCRDVKLDVDLLIPSRLLIQANSGGGKSFLLRRLIEALWKIKVQTIVIDPEGEFYTLREKFGYVLVGENGETPADVRSAALLAEKFLQLKASAVCDLYEAFRSKPMQQRQWVRAFLNALLDAPRALWHPLVVVVDEAHKFCPQESPKAASMTDREIIGGCKDSMIALSTTGRKRGFCPIWATQRLAKLDKDASAEFFNRMVGMTIEDVDVDRAADLMSVSKADRPAFRASLRQLTPGEFYCFGRAITTERELVKVGPVETHHPETGKAAKNAVAPPMPEEVKGFLPQLSDLPKQAEDKARSEAEWKRELADLRRKLAAAERKQPASVTSAPAPTPKADPRQARTIREYRSLLEEAMKISAKINAIGFEGAEVKPAEIAAAVEKAAAEVGKIAGQKLAMNRRELEKLKEEVNRLLQKLNARLGDENLSIAVDVVKNEAVSVRPTPRISAREPRAIVSLDGITGPQGRILTALAEFAAIGIGSVSRSWVAARAGASSTSSSFANNLGTLRSGGLIDYSQGKVMLTAAGKEKAGVIDTPLTPEEMAVSCKGLLTGAQVAIFDVLYRAYPGSMSREDLASAAGASPTSSSFANNLGAMRSAGMIDYGADKTVHMQKWIFLDNGEAA